jgi:hypothetical protein
MNKKLDPGLRAKLRARNEANERIARSTERSQPRIGVIVEFTGSLEKDKKFKLHFLTGFLIRRRSPLPGCP